MCELLRADLQAYHPGTTADSRLSPALPFADLPCPDLRSYAIPSAHLQVQLRCGALGGSHRPAALGGHARHAGAPSCRLAALRAVALPPHTLPC